jgi:tRNA(Arg) A34 adenosine deaminase TadA
MAEAQTESHEIFMRKAIETALVGLRDGQGGPFGAVVVRGGEIIGVGNNQVTATNDPTAHAEIVAIRDACRRLGSFQLTGCTIYATCEPCPMCLGAIYWARPAAVFYACTREDAAKAMFDDQFIYDEFQTPIRDRRIPMRQIMRGAALPVFEAWRAKSDKVVY